MKYSINSKKLGKEVEFFAGNGTSYVFVNLNGMPGTLGNQICAGGNLSGSTISFHGESKGSFAIMCDRWWSAHLRNIR